ncbi:MAG: hypothetical protein ACW99Q_14095 [Candidatus Kariarchaeaceae archaeon]|jgi:hypothetical protein
MKYDKGILNLLPLRLNDKTYHNIKNSKKSSVSILKTVNQKNRVIILKGILTRNISDEEWERAKFYWKNNIPSISKFYEINERYNRINFENKLLRFQPNQISSWNGFDDVPEIIDMEII